MGDKEVKEIKEVTTKSIPAIKCEDCYKIIINGDMGGKCSETGNHSGIYNNTGYLCKTHYGRAKGNGGKCDQCCWWDVT